MGRYPSHYQALWRGRTIALEEHIGRGSDPDPRRAIRVAFHWDAEREVAVVGYIGQHQRTRAS